MTKAIPDILAKIVEQKKQTLGKVSDILEQRAEQALSARRDFHRALHARTPAVIAEIKKASPSKGVLAQRFDPAQIGAAYERGGAAALSVLTDGPNFQGALQHLESARQATHIPVLRKDFTTDRYHVIEAAAHGADAILLIGAILGERELRDYRELAERYRMAALVEVHNADELAAAIGSGATIIGVNNRNLRTFEVDLEVSLRLALRIPAGITKVAESGIHTSQDVQRLRTAGYQAFLVGEHLMKSDDPATALRMLLA